MLTVGLSHTIRFCWGMFPLHTLCWEFFNKWMLDFFKTFFSVYWGDSIVFILQFGNVVNHMDWFADMKPSLHPWYKSHLFMMYDPFNVLSSLAFQYFVEDFCIYVHQWYWSVIFFLCVIFIWFWYQGDAGLVELVWKYFFLWKVLE